MLVTSPRSLKCTSWLNPRARAGGTQPCGTRSRGAGPVMALSSTLAVVFPEVGPRGHLLHTKHTMAALPRPLWGQGWVEDWLISVCFVVTPNSPAPSCRPRVWGSGTVVCAVPSTGHGLRVDMPHAHETFSSCSSQYLFPWFFCLQTTVLLQVLWSAWLKIHAYS